MPKAFIIVAFIVLVGLGLVARKYLTIPIIEHGKNLLKIKGEDDRKDEKE